MCINYYIGLCLQYFCCIHTETMKHTRGKYTDNMTDMAGKIVGMMGKDIDNIFQTNIGEGEIRRSSRKGDYHNDIVHLVGDLLGENLFGHIPGRQHRSFPGFLRKTSIRDPGKLKGRLDLYTWRLDSRRSTQPEF